MKIAADKWQSRLDFAALCVWLILGLVLALIAFTQYGMDFRGYYAATRVLLEGGNPYAYEAVSRVLLEVTGSQGNNPYYYPPWFAWLFIPLAWLPFTAARAIWMLVNYLLWNMALFRAKGALGWSLKGWRLYGLFALTTFSFAWVTWRYEQAGILLLLILVELIISIKGEKWTRAGIWLALLLIKPNITLMIALGVALWLIQKNHWHPLIVALAVSIGLLIVSTLITPDWYKPLFTDGFGAGLTTVLDGPNRVVAYRINSTFPDWLATLGITRENRYVIYAVFLVAGLILFVRTAWISDLFPHVVSVSVLASMALTPYALQYDYPPLVIPLFMGLSSVASLTRGRIVSHILAGFVLSVIFWQQNISWAYWMVVGLIALQMWSDRQVKNQVQPAEASN
jgi:hypothetical protein